jgi:hypothetical protein
MNTFERLVRAHVIQSLRDTSGAPSVAELSVMLGADQARVRQALHVLADEHRLALRPGTEQVWMAHPFSAAQTDFVVRIDDREWYANCVWDGLSILALFGDGVLQTHSPATGDPLSYVVRDGCVYGEGIVHFLVPPRSFWDDIGFT